MPIQFSSRKAQKTITRKLRFLPRLGLVVDIAGREFTLKQAPVLEAIANLKRKELSFKNLAEISGKILNEISLQGKSNSPRKRKATKRIQE